MTIQFAQWYSSVRVRYAGAALFTVALAGCAMAQEINSSDESGKQPSAVMGAQPIYPGLPGPKKKVETTVGNYKVRFYGTVLLNIQGSDSAIIGQDVPLWAATDSGAVTYPDGSIGRSGDNHDLLFSMRQSVLGFTVGQAEASGWSPSALVEFDFCVQRGEDGGDFLLGGNT